MSIIMEAPVRGLHSETSARAAGAIWTRWVVVVGALGIQMVLGTVYGFSVFVEPLEAAYGWSRTQITATASITLAVFAATMVPAGILQDRRGPRATALIAAVLLGAGILATSFATNLWTLYLTYGVLAGAGIGFGYVSPIATCVKWFPHHRGIITGVAVAGFGAGALVFAPWATRTIAALGLSRFFLIYGTIAAVVLAVGGLMLRNPGPSPTATVAGDPSEATRATTWSDMLRSSAFWRLWIMFAFASTAGLMAITQLRPFATLQGLSAADGAWAVSILSIFNAGGRVAWGAISDHLGRYRTMAVMFALQAAMLTMLALNTVPGTPYFWLAAAWIGFHYGGAFALFPAATTDAFGACNLGTSYGLVFTAYGVAGILGPVVGARVFDATGQYAYAVVFAGALCAVATAMAWLAAPRHPSVHEVTASA